MAQVTAFGQQSLKNMPPGVQPPLILKYNAAQRPHPPVGHVEQPPIPRPQLFDFRQPGDSAPRLRRFAGASVPYPFGGADLVRSRID